MSGKVERTLTKKLAIFVLLGFLLENILLHFESHKHMLHVSTVVTDSEPKKKKKRNKMSAKKGRKNRKKERKMDLYESGI